MGSKQKYRVYYKTEPSIPIFSKDWWLDAVCDKDNWDMILVEKGGQIIASIAYYIVKRHMMRIITMPKLTQTMGPWIKYPSNQKYSKRIAFEKKIFTELINKIPKHASFNQNFHYSITNWLPFYWQGFKQTTMYTYVLEDLTDINKIWNGMISKIHTDIKKAQNRFGIQVRTDLNLDAFLDINEMTFTRQNLKLPYTKHFVRRLDNACQAHNARKIFFAQDKEGKIHVAVYIVWDENSAYYLMGGSDPELRNSGANSLCMWKAIQYASRVTKRFDFEGSMIESVERFFRAFGARQMPYFQVSKINSPFLKISRDIRSWGGMLRQLMRNRTRTKSSAKDS